MKNSVRNTVLALMVATCAFAPMGMSYSQSGYASTNPEEGMADITVVNDSFYDPQSYLPEDHRSVGLIDRDPQFNGGNHLLGTYLLENFQYPTFARENDIEGQMRVAFDIDENGKVSNVRVIKGAHKVLEEELVRTIESMPDWQPAMKYGFPAKCTVELPFKASLL